MYNTNEQLTNRKKNQTIKSRLTAQLDNEKFQKCENCSCSDLDTDQRFESRYKLGHMGTPWRRGFISPNFFSLASVT